MATSKKQINAFVRSNAVNDRRKGLPARKKQRKNIIWDPLKNDETKPNCGKIMSVSQFRQASQFRQVLRPSEGV